MRWFATRNWWIHIFFSYEVYYFWANWNDLIGIRADDEFEVCTIGEGVGGMYCGYSVVGVHLPIDIPDAALATTAVESRGSVCVWRRGGWGWGGGVWGGLCSRGGAWLACRRWRPWPWQRTCSVVLGPRARSPRAQHVDKTTLDTAKQSHVDTGGHSCVVSQSVVRWRSVNSCWERERERERALW